MAKNTNLNSAKKTKNDEFYTQLYDIENELKHYRQHFIGKVVYCNCDDYSKSNFVRYFIDKFNELGLKKLITTCYSKDEKGKYFEYNGQNKIVYNLNGDGDFRSSECVELLKESDIVVTNPPFSLFREYVAQLMDYNKKFLIIGNINAITYKEIFPLIKENKLWLGCRGLGKDFFFNVPKEYENELMETKTKGDGWKIIDNIVMSKIATACWFTNMEHDKRNKPFDLYMKYSNKNFPKYDNYNAIEVSKTCDIPMDYNGVMGVPITFLDKYCPEQFEILGIANSARWIGDFSCLTIINGKKIYNRILIRHKR